MSLLSPSEHERILAGMFYNTKDRQYATKFVMGKVWVRDNVEALKEMDDLKKELEDDFGVSLIRLQHMSMMSEDINSFFELQNGRIVYVSQLQERLDQFVFDIHEIINKAKAPMFSMG